jgi:RimJ/RimL family protein N-acetyltransferase
MPADDLRLDLPARLTDGVVVLGPYALTDAHAHWRGEDEEMRRRFDAPNPETAASLEATRAAIGQFIEARAAGGPNIAYAVRTLAGDLVGGCELRRPAIDCVHVSYWTYAGWRGRGFAARSLARLCAAVGTLKPVRRIEAHIDPDNIASREVAAKAGFKLCGETQDVSWAGAVSTRLVYAREVASAADHGRPMA